MFSYRLAWLIDNPLRRLLVSPSDLAERLRPHSADRVLEIGPGSGYFTEQLSAQLSTGTLHLVDLQIEMLLNVRLKMQAHSRRRVTYTRGDATALPFKADSFDSVLAVAVLGETLGARETLHALFNVMRPRARLLVHEHLPDPDMVRFEVLHQLAIAEGFRFLRRWGRSWNYSALFERPARINPQ